MPSRTVLPTAAARGLHREEPPPWVLDDWLTMRLGGDAAVRMGEPMISLLAPAEIEQLLRGLGYDEITHFGPEEARNTYFADRDDVHLGGAERILIATVA